MPRTMPGTELCRLSDWRRLEDGGGDFGLPDGDGGGGDAVKDGRLLGDRGVFLGLPGSAELDHAGDEPLSQPALNPQPSTLNYPRDR